MILPILIIAATCNSSGCIEATKPPKAPYEIIDRGAIIYGARDKKYFHYQTFSDHVYMFWTERHGWRQKGPIGEIISSPAVNCETPDQKCLANGWLAISIPRQELPIGATYENFGVSFKIAACTTQREGHCERISIHARCLRRISETGECAPENGTERTDSPDWEACFDYLKGRGVIGIRRTGGKTIDCSRESQTDSHYVLLGPWGVLR